MLNAITVSELSAADSYFSLLGSIRSRMDALKREWAYACKPTVRVNVPKEKIAEVVEAIAYLKTLELRLDISTPKDDIPTTGSCPAEHLPEEGPKAIHLSEHASDAEHAEVRRLFRLLGTSAEQRYKIFGLTRPPALRESWMRTVMEEMKSNSSAARLAEHKWRMCEEIEQRCEQGWYLVFNTLTVAPEHYDRVFAKGSKDFRDYIRRVDNAIAGKVYGSVRLAKPSKTSDPYHTYVAVVERASRLHIHIIHCFKDIPTAWGKDPNRVNGIPNRRQIYTLKSFWRFGHSMPIACRFNDADAYGRLGWCWPVKSDGKGGHSPVLSKPPVAMARYMCKYLLKAYTSDRGDLQWRLRMSRGFGLNRLKKTVDAMPRQLLYDFLKETTHPIRISDRRLPGHRVRLECLKSLLRVKRTGSPENGENLSNLLMIRKSLTEVYPRLPIGERLRSLMKPMTDFSLASTGITRMPTMKRMEGFDVYRLLRKTFGRKKRRFDARSGRPRREP